MAWSEWKKFGGGSYLTAENTNHQSTNPHSLSLDTKSISSGTLVVFSSIQGVQNPAVNISGATIEETIEDNTGFYNNIKAVPLYAVFCILTNRCALPPNR